MPPILRDLFGSGPWAAGRAIARAGIVVSVLLTQSDGAAAQSSPEDLPGAAPAPSATSAAAGLPPTVAAALRSARVPPGAMAVVVQSLSGGGITLALNDKAPMNPASTMKLVTTYAALNLLGPAYTWSTEAFADGPIEGGVLQGDLALRGAGDPKLVIEELWLLVQKIRSFGVREIRGDLVLDRSAFDVTAEDPGA